MEPAPDNAGVIAPPPLIHLAGILVGAGLDWLWPAPFAPGWAQLYLGPALFLAGFGLVATVALAFRRAGTSIRTEKPTTALVTGGPFGYSRNPAYVALSLAYLGLALAIDSLWILLLWLPVLAVMQRGVIAREERYLEAKFGESYRHYRARVRRWL